MERVGTLKVCQDGIWLNVVTQEWYTCPRAIKTFSVLIARGQVYIRELRIV